jgi:thioredoxin-like negative regulator of GroEL
MRATLSDSSLTRYAGRFVWLELDFDKAVNQPFIARRGVWSTPSLYVLDPATERATAAHMGGLTLSGLERFLDEGERGYKQATRSPAEAALARGDELLGRGRMADAAGAYREALRLAPVGTPLRLRAVGSLTWALMGSGEAQACAETAVVEAPRMPRGEAFGQVVLAGLMCSNQGGADAWAAAARGTLEPLALEGAALPAVLRDHRFQLYQQLMHAAEIRGDSVSVTRLGHRWLDDIDAIVPRDDDERSALDIARVDAASDLGEPERVLPALLASEKAMPENYNASLRLAQMLVAAKRYDDALAACERGLVHATGPVGRTWLLKTKFNALAGKGDLVAGRRVLDEALVSAREIANAHNRDGNIRSITQAMAEVDKEGK